MSAAGTRPERVAEEIRVIVGEIIVRQEIKDPRVLGAGLITVTHVRVTGDLRQAYVSFMVHGAEGKALKEVCKGLNHAAGFVRHRLKQLRLKALPSVEFRIDRVFATEERVDQLLREIGAESPAPSPVDGDAAMIDDNDQEG